MIARALRPRQFHNMASRDFLRLSPFKTTTRRFSVSEKAQEKQPGGQRQLIIASCLGVSGLGLIWLRPRSRKDNISDAGRGANQEYQERAEGNE